MRIDLRLALLLVMVGGLFGCTDTDADAHTDVDANTDTDTDTGVTFDPCSTPGPPMRDRDMSECPEQVAEPILIHISEYDCLVPANDFYVGAEIIGLVEAPAVELVAVNAGVGDSEVHTRLDLSLGGYPVENTDLGESILMDRSFVDGSESALPCDGTQWALGLRPASGQGFQCFLLNGDWNDPDLAPADYASCPKWPI